MALKSMTGYGRGQASLAGVRVTVELSSVNRRQLDLHIVLPRTLSILDARISEEVHGCISRGRVSGEVMVAESAQARRQAIRVDEDLASAYLKALRGASSRLGLVEHLSTEVLLSLPDVIRYEPVEQDTERVWPAVRRALRAALRQLVHMRRQEGQALQADLGQRLEGLGAMVEEIRTHAPGVVERYRRNLHARLEKAGIDAHQGDDRLLREVALFADRSDISEELTRLESHLVQARRLMRSREATGKSLDFLAQELFREINTVGSKANDVAIVRQVVEFKSELERFREQVQNIE